MAEHRYTLADLQTLADALDATLVRDLSGRYLVVWQWRAEYVGSTKADAARQLAEMINNQPAS